MQHGIALVQSAAIIVDTNVNIADVSSLYKIGVIYVIHNRWHVNKPIIQLAIVVVALFMNINIPAFNWKLVN